MSDNYQQKVRRFQRAMLFLPAGTRGDEKALYAIRRTIREERPGGQISANRLPIKGFTESATPSFLGAWWDPDKRKDEGQGGGWDDEPVVLLYIDYEICAADDNERAASALDFLWNKIDEYYKKFKRPQKEIMIVIHQVERRQ